MNYRKSMLSASIVAALMLTGTAFAQGAAAGQQQSPQQATDDTAAPQTTDASTPQDSTPQDQQSAADKRNVQKLGTINVVGIRNAEAESLKLKQEADSHVEVVTAEDIGKLPAKNVADTLQRLPGVNISSQSADEGGFDENDRVSLRGTNPNLTLTTVNGHNIGTGDWFVLSQVQTIGRAVSYSLLPAEIVSEAVVHKTSEAKLLEGGAAGSVDIITRKPLEFAQNFTGQVSLGGVYADLPGATKPQASGLFSFKNQANTFGVMTQIFYEERSLRRDAQEVVGRYVQIKPTDPVVAVHPDLANVLFPSLIGSTSFQQTRKRKGGAIDIELKPTDNLTLNLDAFYAKLDADNINRNFMLFTTQFVPSGAGLQSYSVQNNVLTNAVFAPQPGSTTPYGVYDQISRPKASSKTSYVTLNANWQPTQNLGFDAEIGTTNGRGESPHQNVLEANFAPGGGAHWQMNGSTDPISWGFPSGIDPSTPGGSGSTPGFIFGDQDINVKDDENWFKIDGSYYFDNSVLSSLDFGVRQSDHTRENLNDIGQGPLPAFFALDLSTIPNSNYPGNFADGLSGAFPRNVWTFSPAQLEALNAQFANRDPVGRFNWQQVYHVNEKDSALYLQANFAGESWSGNVGVREVRTKERINYNVGTADQFSVAGPITGSAFGPFFKSQFDHTYNKLLPSANLKFDLRDDLVLRFAASQTLTRPNYSALAGSISADDLTLTGSGGNPQLRPLISTNEDAAIEWYFQPRGLLSASVFNMDLKDYVSFGNQPRQLVNQALSTAAGRQIFTTYQIAAPVNVDGVVRGLELDYIQPIGKYFGVSANYTYAKGHDDGPNGEEPLQGTSKNTYNVAAYFENAKFNARVSYTYRSSFFAGVNRGETFFQDNFGTLSASLGYAINDHTALSFDALNLNNPQLNYFTAPDSAGGVKLPIANYLNGRQYYLTLRLKL